MTPEQRLFFQEKGYLSLPGALGSKSFGSLRESVLAELKKVKLWSAGKKLSSRFDDLPAFQRINRVSSLVQLPDLYARIVTPELRSFVESLAQTKLTTARDAQMLISLPDAAPWSLSDLRWHVDVAASDSRRLPGIQVFALVDDVRPRGGATLALAGSQLWTAGSDDRTKALEILGGPNSSDLDARLERRGLSLLEMSGRAGDVYLMDMRVLHTPSINATKHLRLMATARCFVA